MKHPARHVSRSLRKVSRGRRELSRQVSLAVKKMKDDASFGMLIKEITNRLIELVIRITVISAVNQCIRSGREQAQVVPFRPKLVP
jgi:hypothetical protein